MLKTEGMGKEIILAIKAASAPIVLIMNPDVTLFAPVFRKALLQFRDINWEYWECSNTRR